MSNSTPSIRFKGFTEDWEQCELGNISSSFSGGTPTATNKDYYVGTIPFIRSGEINEDKTELFINEKALNESSAKMVEKGDILYAMYGATSGEVSISKLNGAINQAILAIIPTNGYDSNFIMQWLRNRKKFIVDTYIQGGQGNLSGAIVKSLNLNIPSYNEQYKIGVLLQTVDNLITIHQRKHDNLLKMKKSLLEKLFPNNGKTIPSIRFKGFINVWEQHKLGDIGTTYTGLSGKSKEDFGHGLGRYVTYMNVFKNTIADETMTELIEIDNSQREVKYGDVFFTTSSETPEEVGMSSIWLYNSQNTYLNSFCFGYRLNNDIKINPYFLGYLLRSSEPRKALELLAQGISRFNISKTKVMDIEITIPGSNEEQYKIGKLMASIDNLITLHQRKVETLKKMKLSLLNQMFVQ